MLTKSSSGARGLFWLQWGGYSPSLWDGVVAEAGGSWSHRFCSQEAESKGPCCSALLLLFIWSETPAYETVLLTLKMDRDTAINLSKKQKQKTDTSSDSFPW